MCLLALAWYRSGGDGRRHIFRFRDARRALGIEIPLQTLQIGAYVCGMLVTEIAVFLESLLDELIKFRRQIRINPQRRCGSPIKNSLENYTGSISSKRQLPGAHFIQHYSEGKQIGARV